MHVREDIPSKILKKHIFPNNIEGLFVEINLRKSKWLIFGTYHPPNQNDNYYFDSLTKALDLYNDYYDNFLLAGDFNAEENEPCLNLFLSQYDAKNLVKDKTCFKSAANPSCIDLLLTNSPKSFQNTTVFSTGLSDFHKMALTVLKTKFEKVKPKEIQYRYYKNFAEDDFRNDLKNHLTNCSTYEDFEKVFLEVLQTHAPLKKKYIRTNEVPYMTKTLRKPSRKGPNLNVNFVKLNYLLTKKYIKSKIIL